MAFEESPDTFWQRFSANAIPVEMLPVPYGCPLVEIITPIGVVYAFDRGAPPSPVGSVDVLIAATLENYRFHSDKKEIYPLNGGRTKLVGKVLRKLTENAYLFDVGIPIIVNSGEPLEVGSGLEITAAPPLMLFRKEA